MSYLAAAEEDDGSCHYSGCMDPTKYNYNPSATTNGPCTDVVVGCMDPGAYNYAPLANTESGSCEYRGCADSTKFNYDSIANSNFGVTCVDFKPGCTNSNALNYGERMNTDDGSCIVLGCTDPSNANYDPAATVNVPELCAGRRALSQPLIPTMRVLR